MNANIDQDFAKNRVTAMTLLQDENQLNEIVRLVGKDTLSEADQLKLEAAKSIREDYLQQYAFHEVDTYSSREKQNKMLKLVLAFFDEGKRGLANGIYLKEIEKMPIRDRISRAKYLKEEEIEKIDLIREDLVKAMDAMIEKGGLGDA